MPLSLRWVHKSYPRQSPLRNVPRIPVPPGHPLEPSRDSQCFRVMASRQVWSLSGVQEDSCLEFLGCWALWGRDRSEPLCPPPPHTHQSSEELISRLTSPWARLDRGGLPFPIKYFPVQGRKFSILSYSFPEANRASMQACLSSSHRVP